MFNTLFHYPRVLARHRQGPSAQARERYLTHCTDQGAARGTLLRTARELLVIAQRLDITTDQMISTRQVEAAAERWVYHQQRRGRIRGRRGSRQWFIQTALSWLRFLGRLEVHDKKPLPFADLVEHFAAWMRDQRGLSEVTIRHRCWHTQKFLKWLDGQNRSFEEVSLQELDAFLSLQAAQGWGRVSVATSAKALRSSTALSSTISLAPSAPLSAAKMPRSCNPWRTSYASSNASECSTGAASNRARSSSRGSYCGTWNLIGTAICLRFYGSYGFLVGAFVPGIR